MSDGEAHRKGQHQQPQGADAQKDLVERLYDGKDKRSCVSRGSNMIDITKVRAIDIHTHAEEPWGCHDG